MNVVSKKDKNNRGLWGFLKAYNIILKLEEIKMYLSLYSYFVHKHTGSQMGYIFKVIKEKKYLMVLKTKLCFIPNQNIALDCLVS